MNHVMIDCSTLLGGLLVQLEEQPGTWMFVCASVGDCKAFHYSVRNCVVTDITDNNVSLMRDGKFESDDPGGMLGAYDQQNVWCDGVMV
jgi:hypothetical protein